MDNRPMDFDAAIWKQVTDPAQDRRRFQMVHSLLQRHTLVGMTRLQIENLLGNPEPAGYATKDEYAYNLRFQDEFWFNSDSDRLYIRFKEDRVVDAAIGIG